MTDLPDLFPDFEACRISTRDAEIFVRHGGSGPPLLLLHGYPQTHACWHKITPELQKHYTVCLIDLRGYGDSKATGNEVSTSSYSKRAMAQDCIEVMRQLGHSRFSVVSHDRGARVGYRLALDHSQAILKLVTLDIVPTSEAWDAMDQGGAVSKFHWSFVAQPHPLPEQMIAAAPDVWHKYLLSSWNAEGDLACFNEHALAAYLVACAYHQGKLMTRMILLTTSMSVEYAQTFQINSTIKNNAVSSPHCIKCETASKDSSVK